MSVIPIQLYLFIICIELLSNQILKNKDVKGIHINGKEFKTSLFADDAAFIKTRSHCRSDQPDQTRSCGRGLIELDRREWSGRSSLVGITRASFPIIFDMSKIFE